MKFESQKMELIKEKEITALKLQKSMKEIEDKLKKMGIERPHRGPRISDPAHTNEATGHYY